MIRRGLNRKEAADLLGISPARFSQLVKSGDMPLPIKGMRRWDREAIIYTLDRQFKAQSDGATDAYTRWKLDNENRPETRSPADIPKS